MEPQLQNVISALGGALLSWALAYIPGLSDKWKPLDGTKKRLILLILMAVGAGAIFGLSCASINVGITVACTQNGAVTVITNFVLAAMASQTAYTALPTSRK